jgi:hypothetical protein
VADVSGALSDVSLNTKLPYLIPHLPVLQTADCKRVVVSFGHLRDSLRLRYRVHSPSLGARFLAFVFYTLGGLRATVLHLLRRGIFDTFFHRTSDSRITNESCEVHDRSSNQSINQPFARLSCPQNGATFVSLCSLVPPTIQSSK